MRPFLVFSPRGPVPEEVLDRLSRLGAEILVAAGVGEAAAILSQHRPDLILVTPPARAADVAPLLAHVDKRPSPPPVILIGDEPETSRAMALETISEERWHRATTDLEGTSAGAASAVLLSRVQLATFLELWETTERGAPSAAAHVLRRLALMLGASRVSLLSWVTGTSRAHLLHSSLGESVVGLEVDAERYPELAAAAAQGGPVLVEEVDRDPLMDGASHYLAGQGVRSLLCQKLPGTDAYLHALSESEPFGVTSLAMFRAAARLLAGRAVSQREAASAAPTLPALRLALAVLPIPAVLVEGGSEEILGANPAFLALTGRLEAELSGAALSAFLRPAQPEDRLDGEPDDMELARVAAVSVPPIPVSLHRAAAQELSAPRLVTFLDRRELLDRTSREQAIRRELVEARKAAT